MTSRIPQSFIDDLLTRIDIVELIEKRIRLRKTGTNYSALCPFHTEKTPSFTVSATKQFYHCFGCAAHGNAISFLMAYDHLEFLDAIETLAAQTGLEIPSQTTLPQQKQDKDIYKLLTKVMQYYQRQLRQSEKAIHYLKSRGLTGEICKHFGIGFAPEGWDNLLKTFNHNPTSQNQLITTGMVIQKPTGCYDRFRDRIMFPIRDQRGQIIAFGGRALGDEQPKYLNSPETPIYHKGSELYGLFEARQTNRELKRLILVEGYMDVIALAQQGITYTVATLGTATTQQHLQRLFRYTSEVVFCFDGDQAGREAAWRALEHALPLMHDGRQIRIVFLPENEDPDSLVRKEEGQTFIQRINTAQTLSSFLFEQLSQEVNLNTPDGQACFAKKAFSLLNKIPTGIFQELMFKQLAEKVHLTPSSLRSLIQDPPAFTYNKKPKSWTFSKTLSPLQRVISLLLQHPDLVKQIKKPEKIAQIHLANIEILTTLLVLIKQNPHPTTGSLLENWRGSTVAEPLAKLAAWEYVIPADGLEAEFSGALKRLLEHHQEERIQSLLDKASQSGLTPAERQKLKQLIAEKA